jgi:dihydroorotate dehydrogenase (NAD+) catalytic subunit
MSKNQTSTAQPRGPDLSVQVGKVRLARPVLLASGTCGYGTEYTDLLDFGRIGGLFTKSITLHPRKGNAPPRTVETSAGMLNAIGLANIGLDAFCRDKIPEIRGLIQQVQQPGESDFAVFVNVAGHSVEDYVTVCRKLDEYPELAGVELNVSCPNVSDGLTFGTDPLLLGQLVEQVRRTIRRGLLVVKLSPNVTDICATAKAAVDAGADALSLVNTYVGMAINITTGKPILSNVTGGLSGPAIKPLALCAVYKVYRQVAAAAGVPLFGLGGIVAWQDAAEFVLAGASAVVVGTGTFVDPTIAGDVTDGLRGWLKTRGFEAIAQAVGQAGEPPKICPTAPPAT